MWRKTDGKFTISPVKNNYGCWSLDMLNNETKEIEHLHGWLTLREAYEFLRAFYKGLEIANIM